MEFVFFVVLIISIGGIVYNSYLWGKYDTEPEPEPEPEPPKQKTAEDYINELMKSPARFEHTHILGATGTGKTELLKQLIADDVETNASVIVMAPKGNLIRTLARMTTLDADRLILIEPDAHVALNLFDLGPELLIYVFESLLESEPTPKQKAFLNQMKVKNLAEFRAFLKKKHDNLYSKTAEEMQWRLDLLLSNPLIEQMFSHPHTQVYMDEIMSAGKVLLIDTSLKKLGEIGSSFFGRFFIALIALATERREPPLRPVYVYIDECATYLTDYLESLLDRAREAKVGLTLAHQSLAQLTPKLEASIHNTALKYVGRCNDHDSKRMGAEMGVPHETLKNQQPLSFYFSGRGYRTQVRITAGLLDELPHRTDRELQSLIARQREHFTPLHPLSTKENIPVDDPGTNAWR